MSLDITSSTAIEVAIANGSELFEEFMAIIMGFLTIPKCPKFPKCCKFIRPLYGRFGHP